MKIILETTIEGLNYRTSDKCWIVKLATQEMDGAHTGELTDLVKAGGFCKVLLSNSNISKIEEELVDQTQVTDGGKKRKSPSNRLRSVLHVWFTQQGNDPEKFDEFYKEEMEKLISHYKKKLE